MEDLKVAMQGVEELPAYITFKDEDQECDRHFVRKDKYGYTEVTSGTTEPPVTHEIRKHKMADTPSFLAAVKKYMQEGMAIIFLNEDEAIAYFDSDNREEHIRRPLHLSLEYKTLFGPNGGKTFNQKQFLTALEINEHILGTAYSTLPAKVMTIKISKDVHIVSDLDPANIEFTFKAKEGTQSDKFDRFLELEIPIFEGSENVVMVRGELEVIPPSGEGEGFSFSLTNHAHARTIKDAVSSEADDIKEGLDGSWQIFQGDA